MYIHLLIFFPIIKMKKVVSMTDHSKYEKKIGINLEMSTEKPTKKNKNIGNIFYFLNFYDIYQQKWKNSGIESEKFYRFDQIFKKSININRIDLRDLCLKRGRLLRNIKIKIYIEKILKFKDIEFFIRFSLGFSQKNLIPRTWDIFAEKYAKIKEKAKAKGFLRKVKVLRSIRKLFNKGIKNSNKSPEMIPIFNYINIKQKKNLFLITGSTDRIINKFNITLKLINLNYFKNILFLKSAYINFFIY